MPIASVEPPPLLNGATEGFRIGDIKVRASEFLSNVDNLLSKIPSVNSTVTSAAFNATDLRLQTLEEAVQASIGAVSSPENEENPAEPDDIQRINKFYTAVNSNEEGTHTDLQLLTEEQRERQQAIELYNETVSRIKQKHLDECNRAMTHLKSLQAFPIDVNHSLQRHRSFSNLKATSHTNIPTIDVKTTENEEDGDGHLQPTSHVPAGEVVVRVAVHLPQAPAHISEEWMCLGSQPLSDLRDVLYCLTEANLKNIEREENQRRATTNSQPISLSKSSAYFYIEGTFYIDNENKAEPDISLGIRKYLGENNIKAPPHPQPGPSNRPLGPLTTDFSVDLMRHRLFEDVWIRIGSKSPGLFCHQAGCEHLITFQHVRGFDPGSDPPLRSQYPFKVAEPGASLRIKRLCEACGLRYARKITHNDQQAPHSLFLWCNECYEAMHYDAEGKALYTDFKVFPYEADYNTLVLHEKKRTQQGRKEM